MREREKMKNQNLDSDKKPYGEIYTLQAIFIIYFEEKSIQNVHKCKHTHTQKPLILRLLGSFFI